MRLPFALAAGLFIVTALPSCHLKESYSKNEAARVAYLTEKKTAPAKINVEGVYYAKNWGMMVLKQQPDGKVSGLVGDHGVVKGYVSGSQVFLAVVDSGWTEYTLELSRPRYDQLKGLYSAHVPFSSEHGKEAVFEKIRR
ncbi:MAG: hypothetical protein WEB60_09665 [Terrimicrobiaceae bacterium]